MELHAESVYEILKEKGVETLHHANSVITSCQFLRSGSLISRGTIQRNEMYQTPQKSDGLDIEYGIWFDIFTDSVDIHARASQVNYYGPVLFVLDSRIIKDTYTGKVWVTKLNPTKWGGHPYEKRWFTSEEDLERKFVYGRFDQMIVFRHCGGELSFKDYLEEIILDDPQLEESEPHIDYYSMAYGALRLAMTEGGIDVEVRKRECEKYCRCVKRYQSKPKWATQMFFPGI
ncbi:MAG: hypothetical protein QOJ02_4279 [Acidobacteriota bacterium]|jgi:hypothetical protein|nr:hypothetical protein [Acidobacteriota bacterium]